MKKNYTLFCTLLIFVTLSFAQVPNYVPSNGLVGWWPFNGNANDESGNGNNGTSNGASLTIDRFGISNSAYSFNGTSDFVSIGDPVNNSLDFLGNSFSISVWVNTTQTSLGSIVTKQNTSVPNQSGDYNLDVNQFGNARLAMGFGGGQGDAKISNALINSGIWRHIIGVYTPTSIDLYVDGILSTQNGGSISAPAILANSTEPLLFGMAVSNSTPFNGQLDDIGIWNRALTQHEISTLYSNEICISANISSGLVASFPFAGNANDVSGNANNGMVNGASLSTDRFGNINNAYSFDGTSNFIEVANSTTLSFTDSFAVSFWLNAPDYSLGTAGPLFERTPIAKVSGAGDGFNFETVDNIGTCCGAQFYARNLPGYVTYEEPSPMPINSWVHLVGSYNGTTLSLYQNNILLGSSFALVSMASLTDNLFIGKEGSNGRFFKGEIDDIRIYNKGLSSCDVDSLFNMADPCIGFFASITPQSSTSFCQGGSVNLNANTGTNYTYQWFKNGNIISNATSAAYQAIQAGSYSVSVSNGSCNLSSSSIAVSINANPSVTLDSIIGFVNINANPIGLNGLPNGGNYSGDGVVGSSFNPQIAGLGKATIKYNYTNGSGCIGSASRNTIVYDTTGVLCTTYDTLTTHVIINDTNFVTIIDTSHFVVYDTLTTNITIYDTINVYAPIPVPAFGLIGWWPFTGNANDLSGNGNNGVPSGATLTNDRFGNPASAYQFNGTSDFIQLLYGGPVSNSPRSVSFWAKTSATGEMVPFDYGDANSNAGSFQIQFNNGCSGIGLDVSNGVVTRGNNSLLDSAWHHYVVVLDTSIGSQLNNVLLYADGVPLSSISCGALNQSAIVNTINTNPIRMGKTADNNVRYFNGVLDDFALYNRALDSSEIHSLFNQNICFQSITVTDTLIIDVPTAVFNPLTYKSTIKVYPNPAKDHITIDYGNFSSLLGYSIKITNSLGQNVFTSPINQQQSYVDLSSWSGNGVYFVHLIDVQNNTVDIRKIVLQ